MDEDRISKLPDEILHQILTSVDIKESVRTSILSKRWQSLWSTLPDLNFDFRRLGTHGGFDLSWSHENDEFMPLFTRFVIQFLSHREDTSSINKLKLSSSHMAATGSSLVEKCIDYAIDHGVRHLDLDAFCHPTPVRFPEGLFASETLRVLKVKQYTNSVLVPKPFVLPNLKTLYLDAFKFKDDINDTFSFPIEPLSSFPNLEELSIYNCEIHGLIIRSTKLKALEISILGPFFSREENIQEISTPELTSFRYKGYSSLVCQKMDLPCLDNIYLDSFAILEAPYTDDIKKKMPLNLVTLLQQLGYAKFVTLTFHTIDVLAMNPHILEQSPPPFPHIKFLKFAERHCSTTETVPETVMHYLTKDSGYGDTLLVELTSGIFGKSE